MDVEDLAPVPPRPTNWDELFAITGGLTNIPIEIIETGRLDHAYHFPSNDLRKCGRRGCERKHCNGLLVAISGRRFVHIGHCCARKYVTNAARWDESLRQMRQRVESDARNQAMVLARDEAQKTLHWLDHEPKIDAAIRSLASFLQQARGPLRAELEARAEKRQSRVEIHRRLSAEDRDAKRVMLAGNSVESKQIRVDSFEQVFVGELSGLGCLRTGRGPSELKRRLETLIWTLLRWTPATSAVMDVASVHRATRDLIPLTNDLKESIRNTERLLRPRNLDLISRLDVSRRQGVQSIRKSAERIEIIRAAHWGKAA